MSFKKAYLQKPNIVSYFGNFQLFWSLEMLTKVDDRDNVPNKIYPNPNRNSNQQLWDKLKNMQKIYQNRKKDNKSVNSNVVLRVSIDLWAVDLFYSYE